MPGSNAYIHLDHLEMEECFYAVQYTQNTGGISGRTDADLSKPPSCLPRARACPTAGTALSTGTAATCTACPGTYARTGTAPGIARTGAYAGTTCTAGRARTRTSASSHGTGRTHAGSCRAGAHAAAGNADACHGRSGRSIGRTAGAGSSNGANQNLAA